MNIPKKDRVTLKSYFVKNAIPTEGNFGDLIDGVINQVDDGLAKLPGDPLALEAAGDAGSPLKVLQLYRDFADSQPDWVLSLAPRSDANDAASGKAGLAISDGAGKHHLFIEQTRGRLGVGTVEPQASLHVQGGSDASLSGGGFLVLGSTSGANLAMDANEILARKNGAASPLHLQTDGGDLTVHSGANSSNAHFVIQDGGAVGIGTKTPQGRLHVLGGTDAKLGSGGYLVLGATNGANLALNNDEIQARKNKKASPLHLQADGGALVVHHNKGGTSSFTVKDDGAVGIGTSSPASRLQVLGGSDATLSGGGYLVLGDAAKKNLIMDDDKVQARNNGAVSPLYLQTDGGGLAVHSNRAASTQIVVKNDGNVGLGTSSPKAKLDVHGDVFVKGSKPFVIKRFKSFTFDKSTGMSTTTWAAAIVGFAALGGDINEKGKVDIIKLFVYEKGGKWYIRANFASHSGDQEKWTVDVLFIRKELASQDGSWPRYD